MTKKPKCEEKKFKKIKNQSADFSEEPQGFEMGLNHVAGRVG